VSSRITSVATAATAMRKAAPSGVIESEVSTPQTLASTLAAPGESPALTARATGLAARCPGELVTATDITHGRALIRLNGSRGADVLARVCGIDTGEDITPDGAAFRTSVASVATDVIRDDTGGERSYLLHCERSSGAYLFGALLTAGGEFGIEIDGFTPPGI
jgi:heterotetrameric sarcosine oxidase gamma subunit